MGSRQPEELTYRLPGNVGGSRPGAHRSRSRGAGMNFISHARLLDQPDPRRLDLRASIGNLSREWLVRVNQQRASINVSVVVDVSASMRFGAPRTKVDVAADFLESLGMSASSIGDAVGLEAFDQTWREDLSVPLQFRRGAGEVMADTIRHSAPASSGTRASVSALRQCLERGANRGGLIFVASDFHFALDQLDSALDVLSGAMIVPLVIWDRAEVTPPARTRLLPVRQLGGRMERHVWLTPRVRRQWQDNVERRRREITDAFASRDIKPFMMTEGFDAQALSRHFLEASS